MVRIEIKKVAEGQVALGMEAKEETPDEVLMCAARGFVGVARNLLGPMATNPQFAEEISRGIKGMLLDTEDLKVTRGVEGKEAKFIAALYGMSSCLRLPLVTIRKISAGFTRTDSWISRNWKSFQRIWHSLSNSISNKGR